MSDLRETGAIGQPVVCRGSDRWYRSGLAAAARIPARLAALVMALVLLGVAPIARAETLTLTEFARDRTVFDSGAAFGRDAARVPLSGRAPPGTAIEARAVAAGSPDARPDPALAPDGATPWQRVATADAAGAWSGWLEGVARAPGWWRIEIRRAGDPAGITRMQARFAAGHVIDVWGQSEWHRAVLPGFAGLRAAEPLHDPEALQVSYVAAPGAGYGKAENRKHAMVTDATPVSSHMTALSNALAALRPGEKFHVVFHVASGTSKRDMVGDSRSSARFGRHFADDLALHRFAYPEGEGPGLAMESWYNADASRPDEFVPLTLRAVAGINPDGSPHVLGQNGVDHHLFPELYDPDRTVWAILGPHRFDVPGFERKIPVMRAGLAALFDPGDPAGVLAGSPVRFHRGLEPLTYLNGRMDGTDLAHPNTGGEAGDGMHRLMRLTAAGAVEALGLAPWTVPEFDRAILGPEARYVDLASSAGPVSTTRAITGNLADLPPGQPQVWGFRHNGRRVSRVDLADGAVRIYPEGAARFAPGDLLEFASDGVGADSPEQVSRIQVWRDHPIVAIAGVPGLEGIPLRARTSQKVPGLFPEDAAPADANPAANLLPEATARFRIAGTGAGWKLDGKGWSSDGSGRLTGLPAGGRAQGNTGPARGWTGRNLVLGFVMTSPDGASGQLSVVAKAAGGGSSTLWQGTVPIRPGERVTLPLGRFPADRNRMTFSFQRRGPGTGTLEIVELSVKPAR